MQSTPIPVSLPLSDTLSSISPTRTGRPCKCRGNHLSAFYGWNCTYGCVQGEQIYIMSLLHTWHTWAYTHINKTIHSNNSYCLSTQDPPNETMLYCLTCIMSILPPLNDSPLACCTAEAYLASTGLLHTHPGSAGMHSTAHMHGHSGAYHQLSTRWAVDTQPTWHATNIWAVARLVRHSCCTKRAACRRMARAQAPLAKRATVGTMPTRHMVSMTEASLATRALASSSPAITTCMPTTAVAVTANTSTVVFQVYDCMHYLRYLHTHVLL